MLQMKYLAAALLLASASAGDARVEACGAGPWEAAVEDWATAARGNLTRHGRIMSLPPSQGYYVSDRIDLMPPPPPPPHYSHPPHSHMHHRGPYPIPGHHPSGHHHPPGPPPSGSQNGPPPGNSHNPSEHPHNSNGPPSENSYNYYQPPSTPNQSPPSAGPSQAYPGPHNGPPGGPSGQQKGGPPLRGSPPDTSMPYDEWAATPPAPPSAGKIVNRPPNPYKDQFKPSYAPPPPPPPRQPAPASADRIDSAPPLPQKQVSETDLYLLRAIEKLVYRVDLMEKRMRKMEENMHLIVAGVEAKPEPCQSNFTRIGSRCYHFSADAVNWKSASYACRKLRANLLELHGDEKRQFETGVFANNKLKGADLWTGGLNPGLLWIWSHSAKPVAGNGTDSSSIAGEGRCLALVAAPAAADYVYRGQDCALRHRYVCERDDDADKLSNEIERVAKSLREGKRKAKIAWD